MTRSQFENQVLSLAKARYKFVTLEELLDKPEASQREAAITLDDGYLALTAINWYASGTPVAKRRLGRHPGLSGPRMVR